MTRRAICFVEEWRAVVEAPQYEVSNRGRVRRDGRVLKPADKRGYRTVSLSCGGSCKTRSVHLLVLAAFVGPRPEGYETHHKNHVRHDNRLENLEYVTSSQNTQYACDAGRVVSPALKGEKNGRAKLSDQDVADIRRAHAKGATQAELIIKYGVDSGHMSRLVRGLVR